MKTFRMLAFVVVCLAAATAGLAEGLEHPTAKQTAKEPASTASYAGGGILAAAAADGRFTSFLAAVEAADLTGKLQAEGPFTVFAPTDEAFARLPEGVLDDLLKPANRARLAGLLANHVVPGQLHAADVKTMKATNISGHDLSIVAADGQVTVDGAHVVGNQLKADNGVIHAIDAVLAPAEPAEHPQSDKPKDHPAH